MVDEPATELFGSHIARSAERAHDTIQRRLGGVAGDDSVGTCEFRQTEVEDLHPTVAREEQIFWLRSR